MGTEKMTAWLRIQCGGTVSLDGQDMGRLDFGAYEYLASLAPEGRGWEHGDSLTFRMELIQAHNYPLYCLPGCNRHGPHDGREAGECTRDGEMLKPGPLDLVHRHPDVPVNVPVRNKGIEVFDMVLPESYTGPFWAPFRDGGLTSPLPAKCYRMASGAMVHVKPECRCPR